MSKTFRRKQDDFKKIRDPGKKKPKKEQTPRNKRDWDRVPSDF